MIKLKLVKDCVYRLKCDETWEIIYNSVYNPIWISIWDLFQDLNYWPIRNLIQDEIHD